MLSKRVFELIESLEIFNPLLILDKWEFKFCPCAHSATETGDSSVEDSQRLLSDGCDWKSLNEIGNSDSAVGDRSIVSAFEIRRDDQDLEDFSK